MIKVGASRRLNRRRSRGDGLRVILGRIIGRREQAEAA